MPHQPCIDFVQTTPLPANDTTPQQRPPEPRSRVSSGAPILDRIPLDYALSEALRGEAKAAGVLDPDAHLARLRTGPIGGARGIFADQLDAYIRACFGKWRTWEETDRAKAQGGVDSRRLNPGSTTPPSSAERIPGWPAWVRKSTMLALKAEGRDAAALAKLFAKTHHIPVNTLDVSIASQLFEQFVERVRKEAA